MSKSMTPERAIEILKNLTYVKVLENNTHSNIAYHSESACKKDNEDFAAIQMAISALERQIPKKPLIKTHTYSGSDDDFTNKYYCPVCNELIVCEDTNGYYAGKIVEHCPCGQALDWSDEE